MKYAFRKIASVLASVLMVSSTIGVAAAAYPQPFVSGGNADVAVVYGSSAANTDLVAALEINTNLAEALAQQTATGSTGSSSTVSGGDYVKLGKSSDNLNLGNNIRTVFGSTITDDDLEVLLADGTYSNDENTEYDYEQRITLGNDLILEFFSDSDYKDRAPTVGINITSGRNILNYTLDFTTDVETDVDSNGDLADIETTNLRILGKDYFVLDADNATTTTTKLTLLDSASSALVTEGETQTLKVGDKSYDVAINFVSSTAVKLDINGEVTNSLASGGTFKLSDGTYVGIKDILFNSKDTGISKVEFSIGSGKLELTNGQAIELNDDTVQEIYAYITRGTASGGKEKLDKITLQWLTDDDTFVTGAQEVIMPGFKAIKLSASEFSVPSSETTEVVKGGSDYIQLKTTIKDGAVTIPLVYANASGEFSGLGKDANNLLVTSLNTTEVVFNDTRGDEWLVASWNSTSEAESYLLSFTVTTDTGINRTTVRKYADGAWTDACKDKQPGDTCNLGSLSLTISRVYKSGSDKAVAINTSDGSFRDLYTKEGLKVQLPVSVGATAGIGAASQNLVGNINFSNASAGYGYDTIFVNFTEEDKDDNIAATPSKSFYVTLDDQSDGDVEVSTVTTGRQNHEDQVDDDNTVSRVQSDLSTEVWRIGDSSSQREAKIVYSGGEAYSDIFLTDVSASISSTGATSGSVKSLGSVAVTDAESASVSGKNLIVVGGSCVNSVAAELLGGALCGADFEAKAGVGAGSFLIETFSRSGGKVATLVAGYNAQDTSNAAKYLTTQTVDTTAGKKYTGSSATSAELVTSA